VGYLAWHSRGTTVWRPLRMPWATIWTLAGVGLPSMLQNLMWFNMTNVDKVLILSVLGRESVAYYAIAQAIGGSLLLVSGAVTRVNGPLMIRRLAETSDPSSLYSMVRRSTTMMAYGLPILAAAVWVISPAFFRVVLPRYETALPLLDIVCVSMTAIGITLSVSSLYLAMGRQGLNAVFLLGSMCGTLALSLVFLALGWGTLGVAVASAISSCVYLVVFLTIGFRMMGRSGQQLLKDVGRLLPPVVLCGASASILVLAAGVPGMPPRSWMTLGMFVLMLSLGWRGVRASFTPRAS